MAQGSTVKLFRKDINGLIFFPSFFSYVSSLSHTHAEKKEKKIPTTKRMTIALEPNPYSIK